MRGLGAILTACVLVGCAGDRVPAGRWLPQLRVGLQLQRDRDRRLVAADSATGRRDARWGLVVGVDATWRAGAGVLPQLPAPRLGRGGSPLRWRRPPPCPSSRLCAWERRARARALAQWAGGSP